jgi:hypothetical protein
MGVRALAHLAEVKTAFIAILIRRAACIETLCSGLKLSQIYAKSRYKNVSKARLFTLGLCIRKCLYQLFFIVLSVSFS